MNPLKAADDGVLRTALAIPAGADPSPDHPDWIRSARFTPQVDRPATSCPVTALVLVDADAARRDQRRDLLTGAGVLQVVSVADAGDIASALPLLEPQAVVVTATDATLSRRLIAGVRAQFHANDQGVPVVAWLGGSLVDGSAADLLAAGADAVVSDVHHARELVATVDALRRLSQAVRQGRRLEPARVHTVFDAVQAGVVIVERTGQIRQANEAVMALWRETTGQRLHAEGVSLVSLVIPADRDALTHALSAQFLAAVDMSSALECTLGPSPMRGIPVEMRFSRVDDGIGEPVVVAQVTDLRERRRMEEQARTNRWRALDRQQTLDVANRLRGLFAAMAQTFEPLAGSKPSATVTLTSTQLAMLRGSLGQGEQLLDALQALAAEQEHPATLLDVRTLVESQLMLFSQMLPTHLALTWDVGNDAVLVRGSEGPLQQALTALVMNAWDVQRSGGAIHVSVRHTDDVVVVSVEDQGPGVLPEHADWIFQPMTTTRGAEGASGMGLVTSRRVVEMHGGQLRLDRYCDVGARFEMVLPRYRPRTPASRPQLRVEHRPMAVGL